MNSFILYLNLLLLPYIHLWYSMPEITRLGIRFALAMIIGIIASWPLFKRKSLLAPLVLVLSLLPLFVLPFLHFATQDFLRAKEQWLNTQCLESRNSPPSLPLSPAKVDGFLAEADFNYHLFSNIIGAHNPLHRGLEALPGKTYADRAINVLMDRRFSYVEFKLYPAPEAQAPGTTIRFSASPEDSVKSTEYRLYWLAPRGHPQCVVRLGDKSALGWDFYKTRTKARQDSVLCLAMEKRTSPISSYAFVMDDYPETRRWSFHTQGLTLPAWTSVSFEGMDVIDKNTGRTLSSYRGFNLPSKDGHENAPFTRCGNINSSRFIDDAIIPNKGPAFVSSKDWFPRSAVQQFYDSPNELPNIEISSIREPFEKNFSPVVLSDIPYTGERCPDIEINNPVSSLLASAIEKDCTRIENLKVSCSYPKDTPTEEWSYSLCGHPRSSITQIMEKKGDVVKRAEERKKLNNTPY